MVRHVLSYVYGLKMTGAAESVGRLISKNERTVREWRLLHTKRSPVRIEGVIAKSSVITALIKYPKECNPVA